MASATSASRINHSIAAPWWRVLSLIALAALTACTSAPPPTPAPTTLSPAAWSDLPGYESDRLGEAWPAVLVGCRALLAKPPGTHPWRGFCEGVRGIEEGDEVAVREFLTRHLIPYRIVDREGRDSGLVTGYYEAKLKGSREPTPSFRVPLHARPDDLLTVDLAALHPELEGRRVRGRIEGRRVVPYWARADIERGKASLDGKALAFVADPLDAFFLEIQGSGRIELADGSVLRLGYADQNGHPYRAIGRVLVDWGELALADVSLATIRRWARANPERLRALLDENPSYVFFREIPAPRPGTVEAGIDGPLGSLGVPLLARRTIAVDPSRIPLGAPVWLATTMPAGGEALQRLVLAQDTGGAIRGAIRADFFWGFGDEAMERAGAMREQGRMWLLWPRDAAPPVAPQ